MGRPKKIVIPPTQQELFNNRFKNRQAYRAYLDTVIPNGIHADGSALATFFKNEVFKHENTFSEVTVRGDYDYPYLTIDLNVSMTRKRQILEKAAKYGFFLTCHYDVEGYIMIPSSHYIAGLKATYATDKANRRANGATVVRGKRTRKKK
jgi:hypothetical protein